MEERTSRGLHPLCDMLKLFIEEPTAMPKSAFSWLHLTDLHYGLKGQGHLWPNLREPFLDSLADLHKRCGPWDAVLFTGDLVQSGESAQFERMQSEFLDPLWKRLEELESGDALLLAVPGNYRCPARQGRLLAPAPGGPQPALSQPHTGPSREGALFRRRAEGLFLEPWKGSSRATPIRSFSY